MKRMEKVIVIRHAESTANTKGIYQGQTYDTDLSPLGKKQARVLSRYLERFGIKRVITSPLKRTYQTALEISKVLSCDLEIDQRLIEINHGLWEGKTKSWIRENLPESYMLWLTKPSRVSFPKGEKFTDTVKRVVNFLENEDLSGGVAIVTHDAILRIITSLANGNKFDRIWDHVVEPAAVNYFQFMRSAGKNKLKLLKLNDNKHLLGLKSEIIKHAL